MAGTPGDFGSVSEKSGTVLPVGQPSDGVSSKRKAPEASPGVRDNASQSASQSASQPREYLRVYETMPCQLLNTYGTATFGKIDQEQV